MLEKFDINRLVYVLERTLEKLKGGDGPYEEQETLSATSQLFKIWDQLRSVTKTKGETSDGKTEEKQEGVRSKGGDLVKQNKGWRQNPFNKNT